MLKVDRDFMGNFGLAVVVGRWFERNRLKDSTAVILIESTAKQFGFDTREAAVGQGVLLESNELKPNEVIAVIRDYHQH